MRILVVEDDNFNSKMVEYLMQSEGHEVDTIDNPVGALTLIERRRPHLILLDINFDSRHKLNGFDLYEQLKQKHVDIPVIFVTSRDDLDDKLRGFALGADDYITKPYAPAEVVARVRRVLHRVYNTPAASTQQQLRFRGIELNVSELSVLIDDKRSVALTKTEMKLLMHLMLHADQVVTRDDLLVTVWGENYPGESNIVDSYIRKLRIKVEQDPAQPQYIKTARGMGYKFSTK